MTHKDIYIKFMIEYDKANVTSSYPSLTEYEVATFLDKAYNALIAQKVTGNNPRRSTLESDIKSVSDLNPLIKRRLLFLGGSGTTTKVNNIFPKIDDFEYKSNNFHDGDGGFTFNGDVRSMPDNMRSVKIPNDMLYFISGAVPVDMHEFSGWMNDEIYSNNKIIHPADNKDSDYNSAKYKSIRLNPVKLVSHHMAEQFYATSYNMPWIKNPVCFLEDNKIFVLVDPVIGIPDLKYYNEDTKIDETGEWMSITYVKKPNTFVKDLLNIENKLYESIQSVKYPINTDCVLLLNIDRYNISKRDEAGDFTPGNAVKGDNKIHISSMAIADSNYASYDFEWYIECGDLTYDISKTPVESFVNGTLQIGSHTATRVNEDLSFSIAPGTKILAIGHNTQDKEETSYIFSVDYSDLYNYLVEIGKIRDVNDVWSTTVAYNANTDTYSAKSPREDDIELDSNTSPFIYKNIGIGQMAEDIIDQIESLELSYFKYESNVSGLIIEGDRLIVDNKSLADIYTFELDDVVAGELITLAVSYALENVESPRFNNHLQMRGLEA